MMSHTSQNGASDPASIKSRDMMKMHCCSGQIKRPSSCTRVRNTSQMSRLLFKQSAAVSHAWHHDRSRLVLQLRNYHTVIETRRSAATALIALTGSPACPSPSPPPPPACCAQLPPKQNEFFFVPRCCLATSVVYCYPLFLLFPFLADSEMAGSPATRAGAAACV
jgi:hypothetical protein